MLYTKEDGRITVHDLVDFSPKHITGCGQLFRFEESEKFIQIFAKNCKCILKQENDCVIINTCDVDFFENYFDLSTDYAAIREKLGEFGISDAVNFGKGLRILKQNPEESIFSFIVSANNNIPRIQGILSRLAHRYGDKKDGYNGFPTAARLAEADERDLREIGAGYRAPYLVQTAKMLANGFDLDLYGVETERARQSLRTLPGVGRKVADCVLLFAYGKKDVFPVDTWVKKIYCDVIGDGEQKTEKMAERLTEKFGNLSGYAQQYLFHYYRKNGIQNLTEERKP